MSFPASITYLGSAEIAPDIYEVRFSKPAGEVHRSGQYTKLTFVFPDGEEERAFSIASSPQEVELLFVVKALPGGVSRRWIDEIAEEGLAIECKGFFDHLQLGEADKDHLFIATGTGIAPFRAYLFDDVLTQQSHRVDLVFGVRTEEDLFWVDAFEDIASRFEHFSFHPILSRPAGSWGGYSGRVQTLVPTVIDNLAEREIYLCGNPDMVKEVKGLCVEDWGIAKECIHS